MNMNVVKGFRSKEIERWTKQHLEPGCQVVSDGLACFSAVKTAGCQHTSIVTGGGPAGVSLVEFTWVNTMIGNVKNGLIPNVVADRFKTPDNFASEDRPVRFLNLALMTAKKGQFDLVKAFHSVVERGVSAELWLAGDGPIRAELEEQAVNLGIAKKVRFLGQVAPEKVPQLLLEVDVMVVSSHYETFGVVAAEALMSGVPVIATRCGGPECIVQEGDSLLVPPQAALSVGPSHAAAWRRAV